MLLDIIILVGLTLCQGVTGYWAFHVSTVDPSLKRHRWWFVGLTAFGIGLVIWSGFRGIQSQQEAAHTQQKLTDKIDQLSQHQNAAAATESNGFSKIIGMLQNPQSPKQPVQQSQPVVPDVELQFIYAKEPALRILNNSAATARQIKWGVVVWNVDNPQEMNPLPIPFQTFDFLRPHKFSGAQSPFDTFVKSGALKPGAHLFGSATVECPDCRKGRTYWLNIELGKGGWYSLIPNVDGGIEAPLHMDQTSIAQFAAGAIASVPPAKRVPILDPQ